MTKLLSQARDLTPGSPAPSGRGTKSWVYTARSGRSQVMLLVPAAQPRGEPSTPNISAWPNDATVCSLSQVLVRGSIPQTYFLSSTACAVILRRAEKRGKVLPEPLMRALMAVASKAPPAPAPDTSSQFADLL